MRKIYNFLIFYILPTNSKRKSCTEISAVRADFQIHIGREKQRWKRGLKMNDTLVKLFFAFTWCDLFDRYVFWWTGHTVLAKNMLFIPFQNIHSYKLRTMAKMTVGQKLESYFAFVILQNQYLFWKCLDLSAVSYHRCKL